MKSKNTYTKRVSVDTLFYQLSDYIIYIILSVGLFTFILYPLICIVLQSFRGAEGYSLEAYTSIFHGSMKLLKNSAFVGVLSAFFSTILGAAAALCIWMSGKKLAIVLRGILLISMVSPPFIASLAYIELFGRRGLITHRVLGLSMNPYGWIGVVLMQSLFFASMNALLIIGMLEKLDLSVLRASSDLGASSGYTLFRIVFPLIRPSLLATFLMSFIRSLADFGTPIVIGGRFETISTEIYMQIIGYSRLDKSSALNVLLLLPTLIVFVLYRYLMGRNQEVFAGKIHGIGGEERYRIRGIMAVIVYLVGGIFFVMMALEYGSIFFSSVTKNVKGTLTPTMEYVNYLLERNMDTFIRSVVYALIVAVIGTTMGILLSYYMERRKLKFAKFMDFIITLPYMLPGSCFGIGYILAFNKPPLKLTSTAIIVVLNMIYKQLSITTKAATSSLLQLSDEVDRAAQDLGAGKLAVLTGVILPNMKSAFLTGFIHNFTSAMVTAGAVIFLVSPGKKIAVFTMFDSINSGKYGEASAIASFIILITITVNVIASALLSGKKGRKNVFRIRTFE